MRREFSLKLSINIVRGTPNAVLVRVQQQSLLQQLCAHPSRETAAAVGLPRYRKGDSVGLLPGKWSTGYRNIYPFLLFIRYG